MCDNGSEFNDTVDPRVHVELERLNTATDEINKLELELDEARNAFRQLLYDSTSKVETLRTKLGICIERAKPYYEARFCANEALKSTQVAAMKYEKANSAHSAAREMVYLAEQGLGGRTLDPAWQEMLNHATHRVNEAERERANAGADHRFACIKHEAANAKVQNLQKELKRAITKSSLSIRRNFMTMSSLLAQHELMLLPYYEMKAHFNHLLEQQKARVQEYERHVSNAKLTYADALKNLEQISDEIHRNRRKASILYHSQPNKQISLDSNESFLEDANEFVDEYKSLPTKMDNLSLKTDRTEDVDVYKIVNRETPSVSPQSDRIAQSHSSEWTEINLENSSPEEESKKIEDNSLDKPKLIKQKTLPNPKIDNEVTAIKNKIKLDTNISNWLSRSSAKNEENSLNSSRRQSLDNLLGPTSEKMKEIFSQGMMMLNISALTERRNSEPKTTNTDEKSRFATKKIPSPLEKTLTYLTTEDDNSDTDSLSSVEMLNEDQINCLMLDKDIGMVCEQVLGTPINEVVSFPQYASTSHSNK